MAKTNRSAGGVGESQPFIAPEGSFEPGAIVWAVLTLHGDPIPEHLWGLLTYAMTDQGRAEANEGKEQARVQILSDETDKSNQRYRAERLGDLLVDEALDPFALAQRGKVPEGHSPMWLSEKVCQEQGGTVRNRIQFEPVLDKDGKRVQHGNMFLASAPVPVKNASDRYYANLAAERAQKQTEKVQQQSEEIMSAAKMNRVIKRHGGGDADFSGLVNEDAEQVNGELGMDFTG